MSTPASDLRYGASPGDFENSQFNDDSEMNQMEWASEVLDDGMPSYEAAEIESDTQEIEDYANTATSVSAIEAAAASRIEAHAAAVSASNERQLAAEREQLVDYAKNISYHLRSWRDWEQSAVSDR